jgi:iron complex outermembrane receptor protein
MNPVSKLLSRPALFVAVTLVLSTQAGAQDTMSSAPVDAKTMEAVNVVYSTTKTETPVVKIPQSVSVITPDRMQAYGVRGLDESVRYLAG